MSTFQHILSSMVIFVTGALAPWPGNTLLADKPFTHPGILHSRAELDYVKAKVAEGEEPWKSAWEELRSHAYHHYHDRMGLEMPFTVQVVEKNRPERWQTAYASWGTLMHAGQPVSRRDESKGDRR